MKEWIRLAATRRRREFACAPPFILHGSGSAFASTPLLLARACGVAAKEALDIVHELYV